MTNNIENLQKSVSDVQTQLAELKDNVELSVKEKKEKADYLKSQADNLSSQIDIELTALEASTDADAKENIDKLEISKDVLQQISDLYTSILASLETEEKEEKWFWDGVKEKFWNAKDWVWTQWNDIRDKDKRKDDTGKNLLRTTWFVATWVWLWALIYGWCKRLFGKEAREERRQARKERREARKQARKERREARRKAREERKKEIAKLPFWERPIGKVVKWTWIWTLAYLIIHWIHTWDWFKDLFKRWTEKTEKASEQVKHYNELSPEVKEKYESIGDNVNNFYGNVRGKEISYWYESPYDLWTISKNVAEDAWIPDVEFYKWLVPFCMDDGISNVKELLSEKNFTTYIFDKDTTEIIEKIKSWTLNIVWKALWSFVSSLESFLPFSKGSGSLWEKIQKWFESDPKKRVDELNFFFRQYTKVLTYMKDKERAIAYKIAEAKCQSELSGKSEEDKVNFIQDKLADNKRFEENVQKDSRYQKFMNSKILTSGEALTNVGLFDWEMSPILKEWIIEPLDNEFDNIMQVDEEGETIVDKWIKEVGDETLWKQTKSDLVKMCENLKDDIEDNNDRWWLFKWILYLFNTEDSNKETFLEESWLKDVMNNLSGKIDEIKAKIEKGAITEAELKQLKETALAYFAFQKEMEVAIYTLQWIRSDNSDYLRRLIESQVIWFNNFMSRLNKIFNGDGTFWDFLVVGLWTGQITLVLSKKARTAAWEAVIRTAKKPVELVKWVAWRPAFSERWFREALQWLRDLSHKKSYFLHYVLNWKIRNESFLLEIAKNDLNLKNTDSISEVLLELLKWTRNPDLTMEDCKLLWKYAWNTDIKKLVLSENIPDGKAKEILADWFKPGAREFTLNKTNFDELKKVDKLFNEDYIKNSPNAKKLLERILSKSVHDVDDLKYIQELFIDNNFFKFLGEIGDEPKAIRHMAKHLKTVKESIAFSTLTNEINKIWTSWANNLLLKKVEALEDYRRWLAVMEPKEFKLTNSCIKLFWEWDFIDNMKIIRNLIEEGIQGSGWWWKYKVKFEDLTDEVKIKGIIDRLGNSSQRWRETVFWSWSLWTKKFNKFMSCLDELKAGKIFSNADDLTTVLKKAIRLVGKLT